MADKSWRKGRVGLVMNGARRKILIVEDEVELGNALGALLGRAGYACAMCAEGSRVLEAIHVEAPDLVVMDLGIPEGNGLELLRQIRRSRPALPVILLTAFANVDTAVEAMREGATDVLAKPFLPDECLVKVRRAFERGSRREASPRPDRQAIPGRWEVVGASQNVRMRGVLAMAEQAAATDSRILITGESGTGKEVLARLIHRLSPRRERGFFALNCAALSETLLESELFGHERGAFTGAVATRRGIFEVAGEGTLLLDEIASTSGAFQAKLLRAVETGEFTRVGGTRPLRSLARLIATTNTDLQQAVEAGSFRGDLLYRLRVVHLHLPPLRERPEDIPLLAEHLLGAHAARLHKSVLGFSDEALRALISYRWPGNIRELDNVLERAVIVAAGDRLTIADLPAELSGPDDAARPDSGIMEAMERTLIGRALAECGWNKSRAARRLGIGRRTLYAKLAKYGIRLPVGQENP